MFPLPYVEHHTYITSPQVNTCLSVLLHHLPIQHTHLNATEASALYAAI